MADITKCKGTDCQRKHTCYRFTATASCRQSMFTKAPIKEDGTCDYYWVVRDDL